MKLFNLKYILIASIVLIISIFLIYNMKKQEEIHEDWRTPQIVEIKQFKSEDIQGITFDYPIFKNYPIKRTDSKPNNVSIFFSWPKYLNLVVTPQISVKVEKKLSKLIGSTPKNKNGIYYTKQTEPWPELYFQLPSYSVTIVVFDGPGFSTEILFDKIIETFNAPKNYSFN